MKAAVTRLSGVARTGDNQRRLRELAFAYADIADIAVSALRWDSVVLDRTNSRWRDLLSLARLFLGNRFQTTSTGVGDGFSLLFEMSTLFEEYVARMLKRALSGTGLSVVIQGGRLYCLESEDCRGLFQTRPDILVKRGNEVVQIIDTKWKRLTARVLDPKRGVSQSDIYQMIAYGHLYTCNAMTLLYPHHDGLSQGEGNLETYRISGSDHRLEVATIDVSTSDRLKSRLAKLSPIRQCLTGFPQR